MGFNCGPYSMKPSYTPYYWPQANPTEGINRVLKTTLVSYVSSNHRSWDSVLSKVGRTLSGWDELVVALREEFQHLDYDEHLFDEIRRRTQVDHKNPPEEFGTFLPKPTRVSRG
ncbi:hypothetical protein QE152_g30159 [Popillia japonica]|uniref:Uncharacterized protein n=1 Tax=Popillia japonica TaxID=7064 RepID=A0AAW1JFI9_POPJA